MKTILVNALPLTVVGTGVGRYLRGLYSAIEAEHSARLSVGYFIGNKVVSGLPGFAPPGWKERIGQLLWKMPTPVALGARLMRNAMHEKRFSRVNAGWDVYHEAGYFPFSNTPQEARTAFTVHDLSLSLHPEWHPKERVAYRDRFFSKRLKNVDVFCAVSQFTKKQMIQHLGLDPGRIRVTPLGVDEAVFNPSQDEEAQILLGKAGIPERFLLFVGSGDPRKRLAHAIKAVNLLKEPLPLVVVGWSGWDHAKTEGIIHAGYVSDRVLAQLYRRAELLLFPSEYEGFGLPVLEAMACGCPVLASKAEAVVEVGGGAIGYLGDDVDPHLCAHDLDSVLHDKQMLTRMSDEGVARANSYLWKNTARATLQAMFPDFK